MADLGFTMGSIAGFTNYCKACGVAVVAEKAHAEFHAGIAAIVVGRVGVLEPADRLIVEVPSDMTIEQFNRIRDALETEVPGRVLLIAGCKTTIATGASRTKGDTDG